MTQGSIRGLQDPHKIPTTGPRRARTAVRAGEGRTPGARPGRRERDRARGHPGRRRGHRAGLRHHRLPGTRGARPLAGGLVRGRRAAAVRGGQRGEAGRQAGEGNGDADALDFPHHHAGAAGQIAPWRAGPQPGRSDSVQRQPEREILEEHDVRGHPGVPKVGGLPAAGERGQDPGQPRSPFTTTTTLRYPATRRAGACLFGKAWSRAIDL